MIKGKDPEQADLSDSLDYPDAPNNPNFDLRGLVDQSVGVRGSG